VVVVITTAVVIRGVNTTLADGRSSKGAGGGGLGEEVVALEKDVTGDVEEGDDGAIDHEAGEGEEEEGRGEGGERRVGGGGAGGDGEREERERVGTAYIKIITSDYYYYYYYYY